MTATSTSRAGQRFAVLAPVWGEAYVRRFLDLIAPSWLAEGNLGALSKGAPAQLLILTRAGDAAIIRQSPTYAALSAVAQPTFVEIDDLLGPGAISVALTLAYHRGLDRLAGEGAEVCAVLLNADFLLAEGSLRTLADRMAGGAQVVMAASLRVVEDDLVGPFMACRSGAALPIPPRRLVSMALGALHPTVVCSEVDQSAFRSTSPYQLYWRPSLDTLVARHFCPFVLAIRVERPIGRAVGYCDYGLAQQAWPDARPEMLDDSDAFVAIELASASQESEFFQIGAPDAAHVAGTLAPWATEFHRELARHPVIFKAGPATPALDAAVAASGAFVEDVLQRLPPPQSNELHARWLGGVAAWRQARDLRGVTDDPPELGPTPDVRIARSDPSAARGLRRIARHLLVGEPGRRAAHHPYHRLERALARRLAELPARPAVVAGRRLLANLLAPEALVDTGADGNGVVAAIDLAVAQDAEAVAALVARTRPGTRAVLLMLDSAGPDIGAGSIPNLATRLVRDFDILEVERFDLTLDWQVEHAHGALAGAKGAGVPALLRLLANSGLGVVRLAMANARPAIQGQGETAVSAAVLVCQRRR